MEGNLSDKVLESRGWKLQERYTIIEDSSEDCCPPRDLTPYETSPDYYVRYETGKEVCSDTVAVIYHK